MVLKTDRDYKVGKCECGAPVVAVPRVAGRGVAADSLKPYILEESVAGAPSRCM